MFLQASVCPRGGGGSVCLSACWVTPPREQTTPLEQTPPQTPPGADTPWSRHPPGADTPPWSRHNPEQTPPRNRHPPGSRHPPRYDHCCGRYASYCILVSIIFPFKGHDIFVNFIFRWLRCWWLS